MKINQIAAALLTLFLLALLCRCFFVGLVDFRIYMMLVMGVIIGTIYTAMGKLPGWVIDHSGGTLTDDDEPSNLSPKTYLSILFCVIIVALALFFILIRVL